MKIYEALKFGIKELKNISDSAHLDADILLLHALSNPDKSKIWLNNNLDFSLKDKEIDIYNSYIKRRTKQEPVAYITNKKYFYGLEFIVDKNVLIPRPESELIVNKALNIIDGLPDIEQTIIDVGTGSGALIISLVKRLHNNNQISNHQFIGIDVSSEIINIAQQNSNKHEVAQLINFFKGKFLNPLKSININNKHLLLLANLPYLDESEYNSNLALQHEPQGALVSTKTGLGHYEELFKQLSEINNPFTLIIEHHPQQTGELYDLIQNILSTSESTTIKDFTNRNRITIIKDKKNY